MGITYEWHAATGSQAWIVDSGELRDMTEDDSDITSTALGVGFDDGGGGGVVYGEPHELLRYHADIVGRLVQHLTPDVATAPSTGGNVLRVDPTAFLALSAGERSRRLNAHAQAQQVATDIYADMLLLDAAAAIAERLPGSRRVTFSVDTTGDGEGGIQVILVAVTGAHGQILWDGASVGLDRLDEPTREDVEHTLWCASPPQCTSALLTRPDTYDYVLTIPTTAAATRTPVPCRHCGQLVAPDGRGAWVDRTDGDGCSATLVHEPGS